MSVDRRPTQRKPPVRGNRNHAAKGQRGDLTAEEPELIPMTDQEHRAGHNALSPLIAELLADETFLTFAEKNAHRKASPPSTPNRRGRLPSGDESS